jgi:hypothetical protein
MNTNSIENFLIRRATLPMALLLSGSVCLTVFASSANAQINRSRPPAAPPTSSSGGSRSGGSGGYTGGRSNGNIGSGSPRSDRGRISDGSDTGIGSRRGGSSSIDRYNKTQESSAARSSEGRTGKHYYYYSPFGYYPYDYSPYGYDPGGYFPGGYYPYPNGYPYPYPNYPSYPNPRDRAIGVARYDSPYYYCDDMSAGQYINGSAVMINKPRKIYTPVPEYKEGELTGWRDLGADDYLAERNAENGDYRIREGKTDDPELETALKDIKQSWLNSDVEPLANHVRRETEIAVILRGKYQYSLEAGDFLEITRSAYGSASKLRFTLDHLHRKADGIVTLTGRHFYTDNLGQERVVYLSYVLVKMKDTYIITQIASAPDKE